MQFDKEIGAQTANDADRYFRIERRTFKLDFVTLER